MRERRKEREELLLRVVPGVTILSVFRGELPCQHFVRCCAIEAFAARMMLGTHFIFCRPTKLGSLPMLLQCSRLGGKVCVWIKVEHEWPMNHRDRWEIQGQTGSPNDKDSMGVSSCWSLPGRLLMDHRCYPPYKEKDHTGIGAKHSCLACESGQETACPDQYDFLETHRGRMLRMCTSVFGSSRLRIQCLLHDLE